MSLYFGVVNNFDDQLDRLDDLPDKPEVGNIKPFSRRRLLKIGGAAAMGVAGAGAGYYWYLRVPMLNYDGRYAYATDQHPAFVHRVVMAANELIGAPYIMGGGHGALFDRGYDCSGSVSHILYRAGLLDRPLTSVQFKDYGAAGPGNYISIFVKPGKHVFLSVCGLRFDTSAYGDAGEGPQWRATARPADDFKNRHPPGA